MIEGKWKGKEGNPFNMNVTLDQLNSAQNNRAIYNVTIINTEKGYIQDLIIDGIHLPNLQKKFTRID